MRECALYEDNPAAQRHLQKIRKRLSKLGYRLRKLPHQPRWMVMRPEWERNWRRLAIYYYAEKFEVSVFCHLDETAEVQSVIDDVLGD